jgi:hypothetical protein
MQKFIFRFFLLVGTLSLIGCGPHYCKPLDNPRSGEQWCTNSTYHWSISYPPSWTVDDKDPTFVRFLSSPDNALCGIHTQSVPFKTVDEFTDFILDQAEKSLKQRGVMSLILSRRQISLPNNIVGNDVFVNLLPGGASRRIFVLVDGQGFVVDCETYVANWRKLEHSYDQIISSFTVGK